MDLKQEQAETRRPQHYGSSDLVFWCFFFLAPSFCKPCPLPASYVLKSLIVTFRKSTATHSNLNLEPTTGVRYRKLPTISSSCRAFCGASHSLLCHPAMRCSASLALGHVLPLILISLLLVFGAFGTYTLGEVLPKSTFLPFRLMEVFSASFRLPSLANPANLMIQLNHSP